MFVSDLRHYSIAAEANHEHDRRRRKRLDHAVEVLSQVLE